MSSSTPRRQRALQAAWLSFDFGNSAFAVIMITLVLPIYFGNVIVTDGRGDLYWGMAMSISMLLVALTGPVLGAVADSTASKKQFLIACSAITILSTAALGLVGPGMVLPAMILFILGNAGFEGGIVFYNAFLPDIASSDRYGRLSGYGFAAGYIGGFAIILLLQPYLLANEIPNAFFGTAIFFLIFALPLFFLFPRRGGSTKATHAHPVREGVQRTLDTISHISKYRNVALFLLSFFIYNDAILTVIGFSGRYAKNTLGFDTSELIMFFIMIQVVAAVGAFALGFVTDSKGPKYTITLTLILWCIVSVGAYFATDATSFYVIGALAGIALGSSQSASRTLMARLTPRDRASEFFGFYDGFCGKASAIVGPLVFGVMSDTLGPRPAVVSLIAFFVAGLLILWKVEEPSLTVQPSAELTAA